MSVDQALGRAAGADSLLVVCDYDGTIAPLVDDPAAAVPDPLAIEHLAALARLESTEVALLSGRALSVLASLSGAPIGVHLIGSHGAEASDEEPAPRSPDLDTALQQFVEVGSRFPGSRVEEKPMGVAFHYRTVSLDRQPSAAEAAEAVAGRFPDLKSIHGKRVVELTAPGVGKGEAVEYLRARFAANVVVFMGDDVTDEDGFAVLRPEDVGVKVGSGLTAAEFRVDDTAAATELLGRIRALRSAR